MYVFVLISMMLVFFGSKPLCEAVDWCSLKCKWRHPPDDQNTMCKYADRKDEGLCRKIKDIQTPLIKRQHLNLHNQFRDDLASGKVEGWPSATNMRQLSWDKDLEALARRWIVQCVDGHDTCRRTPQFEQVGQNWGTVMASLNGEYPRAAEIFPGWTAKELVLIANPENMSASFMSGSWAHFTQTVWADSYKLGCSTIHDINNGKWKRTVSVCNYGPSGNIEGFKMYERGPPCSNCPGDTACQPASNYPHLCTSSNALHLVDYTTKTALLCILFILHLH